MRASVASRSSPCSRSWRASSRSCRSSSSRRGSGFSTFSSPTSSATSSTRSATRSAASRAARRCWRRSSCGFGHATSSSVMAIPAPATMSGRCASRGRNASRRSTSFSRALASASCRASRRILCLVRRKLERRAEALAHAELLVRPARGFDERGTAAPGVDEPDDQRQSADAGLDPRCNLQREGAGQQLDGGHGEHSRRPMTSSPERTARRHQRRRRRRRSAGEGISTEALGDRRRNRTVAHCSGSSTRSWTTGAPSSAPSPAPTTAADGRERPFGRRNAQRIPAGTTRRVAANVRSTARMTKVMTTRGHQYPEPALASSAIGFPNWSTGWQTSPWHSTLARR